jgi:hypothetical protein
MELAEIILRSGAGGLRKNDRGDESNKDIL